MFPYIALGKVKQLNNSFISLDVLKVNVVNIEVSPDACQNHLRKRTLLYKCFTFPDIYVCGVEDDLALLDVRNNTSG